jgi:peptidyl-prolyl cis-trans isomerase C
MFRKIIISILPALFLVAGAACKGDAEGITIKEKDLQAETDKMIARYQAQGMPTSDEQISQLKRDVLDQMIEKELLLYAAKEKEYTVDESAVQTEIDGIRGQYPSPEEFKSALEAQGYTEESLKAEIAEYTLIQDFLDSEILSQIVVEDAATRAFYNENPQYFLQGETVTAGHILVQVTPEADDEAKAAAKAKIEEIQGRLAAGADFAQMAREYSEGPSAPSGGDLGTFERGQMVPPFEDAAFGMQPGETSGLVETQFGYHLINVRDRTDESTVDFEDAAESIVEYLRQERGSEEVQKYVDELKERITVNAPDLGPVAATEESAGEGENE